MMGRCGDADKKLPPLPTSSLTFPAAPNSVPWVVALHFCFHRALTWVPWPSHSSLPLFKVQLVGALTPMGSQQTPSPSFLLRTLFFTGSVRVR